MAPSENYPIEDLQALQRRLVKERGISLTGSNNTFSGASTFQHLFREYESPPPFYHLEGNSGLMSEDLFLQPLASQEDQ